MKDEAAALRIETLAVHGGEPRPAAQGSVVFPIYQGTVFTDPPGTAYDDLQYIRLNSTPSQVYLHNKLAALEGAEAAIATSSGMAALTTTLLALMKPGDHILAGDCLYGGSHAFLAKNAERLGWTYTLVDAQEPDAWDAAIRPETRVFLCETMTNPLLRVPALDAIVSLCRERGVLSLIDNTFASPASFRPLDHGFDLSFHSATKYLNGHSDVVAGCVMGSRALIDDVRHALNLYGASLDPHAGFLLARGIKTLALRVRASTANALALARALAAHPRVLQVNYPGLETHPDHLRAARLLSGFGGMLSFRIGGDEATAGAFVDRLRLAYVAPSLGGVETLVTLPVRTSHASIPRAEREAVGITDDLVRVSSGIEASDCLLADFAQALEKD
jgi:cystathionine gamma-synthase/cystathionine gamma-lyase/cystathionine beta-lyase